MAADFVRTDTESLDQRQLVYFRATARHEHMGRAADELGISESTLSRSIARLEQRYGGSLFERVGRGLRLNDSGRLLFARVDRALSELETGEQEIRALREAGATLVALAFLPKLGHRVLPSLIMEFKASHPEVRFKLRQGRGIEMREWLLRGEIDVCFTARQFLDPALEWYPVWDDNLVAVMSPDHPFARREGISLHDVANEQLLVYKRGRMARDLIDDYAHTNGIGLNIAFETNGFSTLTNLAAAGYGVAIVPESVRDSADGAVAIPLVPTLTNKVGLFTLKSRPLRPIEEAFVEFVLRRKSWTDAEPPGVVALV